MTEEIIIAGFGGQGVLSMGKILCYSGVIQGKEVSWMPSYGPEMRGGTANVTVILSDERISSPILTTYDSAILLNQQSIDKFESCVKSGGLVIYDGNGIIRHPERNDIAIYRADITNEASKLESKKIANMIMLGAYLKVRPLVELENVMKGLKKSLPERYHHMLPMNEEAFMIGSSIVHEINIEPAHH